MNSLYLRTQRVMNLKILNELRNRVQLPRVFRRRSKKSQKNNLALELFRFEISKSKDCVKRIQRTWRANTWKKAAFFLRLHSSVIACRGPSLLFLFSAGCFLRPKKGELAIARARARARARTPFHLCALLGYTYNRWAVRGKQGRGRRDAPNHYNRPRQ